jgi:hypothetical protein
MGGVMEEFQAKWLTGNPVQVKLFLPRSRPVCGVRVFALRDLSNGVDLPERVRVRLLGSNTSTELNRTTSTDEMVNVFFVDFIDDCRTSRAVTFDLTPAAGHGLALAEVEVYTKEDGTNAE